MARILTPQEHEQIIEGVTERALKLDDPDPDTTYTLRLLTDKTMRGIWKRHTIKRPNRQGQMVEVTDHEAVGRDTVDYVIKDWTGVVARDANGQLVPVPCTSDAKFGLDPVVRAALIEYASVNQRVEAAAQAESFRATP